MHIYRSSLLFLFSFFTSTTFAQQDISSCLERTFKTGDEKTLDSFAVLLAKELPRKDFYFLGEAHTYLANNDLQFALIKALHPYGVYNIVNELPHATCFLFNQYLETGDDSLLNTIKPAATYNILKKVRLFNLSQPLEKQIRYYGIDYYDARYDYDNYYRSLQTIWAVTPGKTFFLDSTIFHYLQKDRFTNEDIVQLNKILSAALLTDSTIYRKHFGRYYDDLLLMSGNMIGYRANRDADIYKSFQMLYRILSVSGETKPKFLSFYGAGHAGNLGARYFNKKNSPIYNQVNYIGIQYVHCLGGWDTASYRDEDIYAISKPGRAALKRFAENKPWQVALATNLECLQFKNNARLSALVIFNNYGTRKMNSWKFD